MYPCCNPHCVSSKSVCMLSPTVWYHLFMCSSLLANRVRSGLQTGVIRHIHACACNYGTWPWRHNTVSQLTKWRNWHWDPTALDVEERVWVLEENLEFKDTPSKAFLFSEEVQGFIKVRVLLEVEMVRSLIETERCSGVKKRVYLPDVDEYRSSSRPLSGKLAIVARKEGRLLPANVRASEVNVR